MDNKNAKEVLTKFTEKIKKKPPNIGRPSKFKDIDMKVVEVAVKEGLTDEKIAEMLRITVRTFHNWKKKNIDFFHSLKDWKEEADAKVEKSLFERATGFVAEDTHICVIDGKVVKTQLKKHYPPDPTSMIFWLKNRKPKEYRDKMDHEVTNHVTIADLLKYGKENGDSKSA